jgi:GntR family transcriptional regulator, transcriptional repressor for pyruvate dehydrogenase complex
MDDAMNTSPPSVVRRCVAALRTQALNTPVGALIGSEDELLAIHKVSRPTLRQAAALVAQEQLLEARRGVRGGYFATRPTVKAVSHMAAIFLQTRSARLKDIFAAIAPVHAEMARLAATIAGPEERARIEAYLAEQSSLVEGEFSYRDFLRTARTWEALLGDLCGNPVLALYLRILIDLAAQLAPHEDIYVGRPDLALDFLRRQRKVAEAILDGDPEMAVLVSRRTAGNAEPKVKRVERNQAWPLPPLEGTTPGRLAQR